MAGPDLAVVGNLILDDVVLPDGSTRMAQPGGAALYVALAVRLWGIEVSILSVIGEDYPGAVLDVLGERGIDLAGVRRKDGPTLRTWLLYEGRRRRVVHRLDGPTHAEVSPVAEDLPADWTPRACHLAPMPFAVQRDLVADLSRRPGLLLSLDPYELVREAALPAWRELLTSLDLLFLSEDEMELPGGLDEPEEALRLLVGPPGRLRQVLYKQGERGGLVFDPPANRFGGWGAIATPIVEPTGAGDAFAGGLLAGRLLGEGTDQAIERGLFSAGIALGGVGPEALLRATPAEAERRLRALRSTPGSGSA